MSLFQNWSSRMTGRSISLHDSPSTVHYLPRPACGAQKKSLSSLNLADSGLRSLYESFKLVSSLETPYGNRFPLKHSIVAFFAFKYFMLRT